MKTKRPDIEFYTLHEAIEHARGQGYTREFTANENGFFDPERGTTYLPESISEVAVIRIDAPLSNRDEPSILYLLATVDDKKGWLSDTFGAYANSNLAEHIARIQDDFRWKNRKTET